MAQFQDFDQAGDPTLGAGRVADLRRAMAAEGVDAFLVPRADEHQGEYVAASSERLSWLTGFTGSAGFAIVEKGRATIFVDGRYTLQVREQCDPTVFEFASLVETPPHDWLRQHGERGRRFGFDPWLHTIGETNRLRDAAEAVGATLVPVHGNLVDRVWHDRPEPPAAPVRIHPIARAGRQASDKLEALASALRDAGADYCVLSDPSSLAWAFNIRGSDVPHTPLVLGFSILAAKGLPQIFVDPGKLDITVEAYLTQLANLHAPQAMEGALSSLSRTGARIALDPALAAERLREIVENAGGTIVSLPDPARLPRAVKNDTEIAGARAAHRRDGLALVRFLAWYDRQTPGSLDEIGLARALEEARRRSGEDLQAPLMDLSFDTISGAGPNGAVIHYRVNRTTNRLLGPDELYLVDSGAQYEDGTTDVTRTLACGRPSDEMRDRFTRVLKGMIRISMLRFPTGTRGCDIDPVARLALWEAGLDYAHGTGHGVGSYLSVHEGPQRIARTGTEKLLPGMILSNEPGYYKPGSFGIRIENLILVTPAEDVPGGDIPMHGFETLTLAPIDRRLIVPELLSGDERAWLDAYHARVLAEIGPMADGETLGWLEAATAPL